MVCGAFVRRAEVRHAGDRVFADRRACGGVPLLPFLRALDRGAEPVASSPTSAEASKPEPGPAERLAYSIDEAARLTGLSRDLLYDKMRRGNLSYVKVGRRRLVTRHHLQQFLGDASA
jgi:excisionase family DNA binding protein